MPAVKSTSDPTSEHNMRLKPNNTTQTSKHNFLNFPTKINQGHIVLCRRWTVSVYYYVSQKQTNITFLEMLCRRWTVSVYYYVSQKQTNITFLETG